MKKLLILTLVLTACGTSAEQQQALMDAATSKETTTTQVSKAETVSTEKAEAPRTISFYLESKDDLPFCDETIDGQLVYVKSDKEFLSCSPVGWTTVEIKGEKGEAGVDGLQGAAGQAGSNGAQGTSGANGQDGGGVSLRVLANSDGREIGRLFTFSSSTYNIVASGGLRYSIDSRSGAISNASIYYTGLNCTGSVKLSSGSTFQNVMKNNLDGKYYKMVGRSLGASSYGSFLGANGSVCISIGGTMQDTMLTTEVTLTENFPIVGGVSIAD